MLIAWSKSFLGWIYFNSFFNFFLAPEGPVVNATVSARSRQVLLEVTPPNIITGMFTYDLLITSNHTNLTLNEVHSPYNVTNLAPFTMYSATVRFVYIHMEIQ